MNPKSVMKKNDIKLLRGLAKDFLPPYNKEKFDKSFNLLGNLNL